MVLAENGKALANIVVGDKRSVVEAFAAEELKNYVDGITGVSLPITTGRDAVSNHRVFVGSSALPPELDVSVRFPSDLPDAFVMRTVGRDLILVGQGDRGTLYAVYTFLERYLDVRFFAPGDQGEEVPAKSRIEVPEINDAESPDLAYRCKGSVGGAEESPMPATLRIADWMAKNKLNFFLIPIVHYADMKREYGQELAKRAISMEVGHHDFDFWVPQHEFFDTHPEYFALVGGERKRADRFWQKGLAFGTQLCLSNPDVSHIVAERMKSFMHENPEVELLDLWPNDNFGACECEQCRALNVPGNATLYPTMPLRSRSYQVFANRVAAELADEFPDRRFSILSYVDGLEPGEDVEMHPNIDVNFALYRECYAHAIDDPSCERNVFYRRTLDKWLRLAKRVELFEYYYKVAWQCLPFPVLRKIFADQRYFKQVGVYGNAPQITAFNFGSMGLTHYAFAKAAWDADSDMDEVVDDYCYRYYGPAGMAARRYFDELEAAMEKARKDCPIIAFPECILKVLTPEVRDTCREAVREAQTTVGNAESRFQRRARELLITMDYTQRFCSALESIHAADAAQGLGNSALAIQRLKNAERIGLDAFAFARQHSEDFVFLTEFGLGYDLYEKGWRNTIQRKMETFGT